VQRKLVVVRPSAGANGGKRSIGAQCADAACCGFKYVGGGAISSRQERMRVASATEMCRCLLQCAWRCDAATCSLAESLCQPLRALVDLVSPILVSSGRMLIVDVGLSSGSVRYAARSPLP
jgi:hypothetical protein